MTNFPVLTVRHHSSGRSVAGEFLPASGGGRWSPSARNVRYVNGIIEDKQKHILIENCLFDEVKPEESGAERPQQLRAIPGTAGSCGREEVRRIQPETLEAYQGIDTSSRRSSTWSPRSGCVPPGHTGGIRIR